MTKKLLVFVSLAAAIAVPVGAATHSLNLRQGKVEQRQEARQERREEIQTRRAELKTKLQTMRDTRKKELVQRLHDRMCNVQQNRVEAQKRHLQSLVNILARVEERANKAKANGKDISAVQAAIDKAKTAIAAAQEAVTALEGRDCGLSISGDETELKGEVRQAQQALTSEVKAVHQKIVAARKAVAEAIRALAKVLGEPGL